MSDATTVLLCGVGGQGTVLAADLLARAALGSGHGVKVSEIHGMAQRGGAVTTVVRFGSDVRSMVCDPAVPTWWCPSRPPRRCATSPS